MLLGKFHTDVPKLEVGREQAVKIAREVLEEKGVQIPPSWREMVSVRGRSHPGRALRLADGRPGNPCATGRFLCSQESRWRVRYATFEGSVEERAEEYRVIVADSESVPRVIHRLPEAREGAALSEEEARSKAQSRCCGPFWPRTGRSQGGFGRTLPAAGPPGLDLYLCRSDPGRFPREKLE